MQMVLCIIPSSIHIDNFRLLRCDTTGMFEGLINIMFHAKGSGLCGQKETKEITLQSMLLTFHAASCPARLTSVYAPL
jgi:hypothetical protein